MACIHRIKKHDQENYKNEDLLFYFFSLCFVVPFIYFVFCFRELGAHSHLKMRGYATTQCEQKWTTQIFSFSFFFSFLNRRRDVIRLYVNISLWVCLLPFFTKGLLFFFCSFVIIRFFVVVVEIVYEEEKVRHSQENIRFYTYLYILVCEP